MSGALEKLVADALAALCRGDTALAMRMLEDAERRDPNDLDVLLLRATIFAAHDRVEEARAVLDRAILSHPNDPVARSAEAALLLDAFDDPQGALSLFQDVVRLLRSDELAEENNEAGRELLHDALLRCAECHALLEDPARALDAANEACAARPSSGAAHVARAQALLALGRLSDAARAVDEGLAHDEAIGLGHFTRGQLRAFLGDEDGARAAFARAASLDPERCPLPLPLDPERFARDVRGCLAHLPRAIAASFAHVEVVAADWPSTAALARESAPRSPLSLVLLDGEIDGRPRVALYRRCFELAHVDADEVREIAAGLVVDALARQAERLPPIS